MRVLDYNSKNEIENYLAKIEGKEFGNDLLHSHQQENHRYNQGNLSQFIFGNYRGKTG